MRVEPVSVPVAQLTTQSDVAPDVAHLILEADSDGDGFLSLEEVVAVFQAADAAASQSSLVRG